MHHTRLKALRQFLESSKFDGFLQPVNDPFMGEYVPACYRRLPWLTGFTGSAGMAAVLCEQAALFVDGRYTLQAAQEVNTADYAIVNSGDTRPESWLAETLPSGARIAYDPWLFTVTQIRRMEEHLTPRGVTLLPVVGNPIDSLWEDRPPPPAGPVEEHPLEFAGQPSEDKRRAIASSLRVQRCHACLLTAPDSVAWLLNIRGRDVPHTPVGLYYALLYADGTVDLFVDEHRVDGETRAHLGMDAHLRAPEKLEETLRGFGARRETVWLDPAQSPLWFEQTLRQAGATLHPAADPCQLPKACKNATELQGMREAHIRDGVAMTRFLHWLDTQAASGAITEMQAAAELERFRRADPLLTDLSFATISAYGEHGAIVHYHATESSNATLKPGSLYLVDSGGQYRGGTTDITRTIAIGASTDEHRDRFTRVLKGHIALARAAFPAGTSGSQLDILARAPLWEAGLDYDHGTGHGVGSYLGVHEGPQRISKQPNAVALQPGMILSNEPGYYRAGAYGIRIENLVAVVPANRPAQEEGGKPFYRFETLTLAPIDRSLIAAERLTPEERDWLNRYHQRVFDTLQDRLPEPARQWLHAATRAV